MTGKEIAAKLREALASMNDSGAHWYQGDYNFYDDDGEVSYCSLGAINLATMNDPIGVPYTGDERVADRDAVVTALAKQIDYDLPETVVIPPGVKEAESFASKIVYWNDDPERGWPDIVAAFTAAADKAEKGDT